MNRDVLEAALPWAERPVWRSIDCGDGWLPIIESLAADLAVIYPPYHISQIKQKMGGLRFYTENWPAQDNPAREPFVASIRVAEQEAERTCEWCGDGDSAKLRGGGWVRTLCENCEAKYKAGDRPQ